MIYDSTFFVALHRERRRGKPGPAHAVLDAHSGEEIAMSVVTRGELARGFQAENDWLAYCAPYFVYPLTDRVLWKAAQIHRNLRSRGLAIGTNDLWIAATALDANERLATANIKEFSRVDGLQVVPH